MPVGQIEIEPEALLNAASALEKIVRPDLDQATDKFANSYRVDPPGWGLALSPLEAMFNMIGDYHVKNLRAGSEAIEAVANGLRKTVDNYNRAEKANVEMFLGSPSQDGESWGSGWLDTGVARSVTTGWLDNPTEVIAVGTQLAFIFAAFATADMSPPYLPAPIVATLLVANGFSMIDCARALANASAMLTDQVKPEYTTFTNGALRGWNDSSVIEYQQVIAQLGGELDDAQKVIASMSGALASVAALLTAFWVAFLSFTGPFFLTILNLTISAVGPQAIVIEPIIQSLGALAGASWLTAVGTVIGLIGAAVTLLTGVVKEVTGVQTFDKQGDNTPDIRQIKIAWHSA